MTLPGNTGLTSTLDTQAVCHRHKGAFALWRFTLKMSVRAPKHQRATRIFIQNTVTHLRAMWLRKYKEKTSYCAINLLSLDKWQLHKSNTCRVLAWIHCDFNRCVIICHSLSMLEMNLTFLVTFWPPFPTCGLVYPVALTAWTQANIAVTLVTTKQWWISALPCAVFMYSCWKAVLIQAKQFALLSVFYTFQMWEPLL